MNNPSIDSAIAELDKLETELTNRLAGVQQAKRALTGPVPSVSTGTSQPDAQKADKGRKRAPFGSLPAAIKAVLKSKSKLTNAQIREAIVKSGYEWPVTPIYVSKKLSKMAADKEVVAKKSGNEYRYELPK